MSIDLTTLPSDVLVKLPFSLQINKTKLIYDDLPTNLQIILTPYRVAESQSASLVGIFDFSPSIVASGDLKPFTSQTNLIIEYITNWFNTRKGSYPYDSTFGTSLYLVLHTKDTALQRQKLSNELAILKRLVLSEFNTKFKIVKSDISSIPKPTHTEYRLSLEIAVLGRNSIVNISSGK